MEVDSGLVTPQEETESREPIDFEAMTLKTVLRRFRIGESEISEAYLLDKIEHNKSKMDVYYACLGLTLYGTSASIPTLKKLIYYPKQDVKCVAILQIARIAGSSETAFFTQSLFDKNYPEKGYAIWAIYEAADDSAIPAILEYFRINRKKLLNGAMQCETATYGLVYLYKFRQGRPDIEQLLREAGANWKPYYAYTHSWRDKVVQQFMNDYYPDLPEKKT